MPNSWTLMAKSGIPLNSANSLAHTMDLFSISTGMKIGNPYGMEIVWIFIGIRIGFEFAK